MNQPDKTLACGLILSIDLAPPPALAKAPGAPAKALLWQNPKPLRSGLPAGTLWHWQQTDLWDAGFVAEEQWDNGWWAVTEPDILYSANFVLAAASVR